MTRLLSSLIRIASLLAVVALTANPASGTQESFNFGGDQGTLEWNVSTTYGNCGPYHGTYTQWYFSGFTHVAHSGTRYPLTGSANYFQSSQPNYCPPTGPAPAVLPLGTSSFMIYFYPQYGGHGSATIEFPGRLRPKYVVLAVVYAPPGSASYVQYGTTTMVSTATTLGSSFVSQVSQSISLTTSGISGTSGSTASTNFTQQQDTSSSVTISKSSSLAITVPGPASDAAGLDHNYDVIYVWLNPVANVTLSTGKVVWRGYQYDGRDPIGNMEIVPLYVYQLKNPSTIGPDVANRLARTWDTSGPGGLTPADYSAILALDPFWNGSGTVDLTRYWGPVVGETIAYVPPPAGGQPITTLYVQTNEITTTQGQGAQVTYSVSFSSEYGSPVFGELLSEDLKSSSSLTLTNKWSQTQTQKVNQTASVSVTGPAYSANYTGPTAFNVYQDYYIYGTFMLFPAN